MLRVATPICTINENPSDSFVALANAPWINIDKSTDRVPNDFKGLFGPHLQGKIRQFHPNKIVRRGVIERIEANKLATQGKKTSFVNPGNSKDGIRVSSINKVEAEPVFHKVGDDGSISNDRLPTIGNPLMHFLHFHTRKVPASDKGIFLQAINTFCEEAGVNMDVRRGARRFSRGMGFTVSTRTKRGAIQLARFIARVQCRLVKRWMDGDTVHR